MGDRSSRFEMSSAAWWSCLSLRRTRRAMLSRCCPVAEGIYGTTPEGVRLAPSVPTSTTTCDSATRLIRNEASLARRARHSDRWDRLWIAIPYPLTSDRVGEEVKIVWCITGKGSLTVTYESPTARPGMLTFGPTPHAGSTYTRPGDAGERGPLRRAGLLAHPS